MQEAAEQVLGHWPKAGSEVTRGIQADGQAAAAKASRRIARRGGHGCHGARPPPDGARGEARDFALVREALGRPSGLGDSASGSSSDCGGVDQCNEFYNISTADAGVQATCGEPFGGTALAEAVVVGLEKYIGKQKKIWDRETWKRAVDPMVISYLLHDAMVKPTP